MSQLPPQPEWNYQYQRYLYTHLDVQSQRQYRTHHVEGQGWVFFDWVPVHALPNVPYVDAQSAGSADWDPRRGQPVHGSYTTENLQTYEPLDPSFTVRDGSYFVEGRMFAVLFTEAAGANAVNRFPDYNTTLSQVQYGEFAHTQVRRFIIVRRKREYCFAVPVFTYGGRGTTKPGVDADEHAIAYSHIYSPQLLTGERTLSKAPIPIVMNQGERPLSAASRIYFGIHHPIQYNVKVKDLGYVQNDSMATFLGYWHQENESTRGRLLM